MESGFATFVIIHSVIMILPSYGILRLDHLASFACSALVHPWPSPHHFGVEQLLEYATKGGLVDSGKAWTHTMLESPLSEALIHQTEKSSFPRKALFTETVQKVKEWSELKANLPDSTKVSPYLTNKTDDSA
jgi:hypothetical protein